MKKTINYEKDIIFKTAIGEICTISLEHDFTVDDMCLKGDFLVSGDYKTNELSVNRETFSYRLPLEYELEPNVDLDTLSYDVENFEYNVKDDVLNVYIDFGVRYEEKAVEPIIPVIEPDEIITENSESEIEPIFDIEEKLSRMRKENEPQPEEELEEVEEEREAILPKLKEEKTTEKVENEERGEAVRLKDEDKKVVLDGTFDDDTYITYHVHIVREQESLETIAAKYNVSVDLIKAYNNVEDLTLKSKLIIPEIDE